MLLIGGSGMLGRAWRQMLDGLGVAYASPAHAALDMTNEAAVAGAIASRGMVVINCAAWTDVDGAEAQPDEAAALNARGPAILAKQCAATGSVLVHYSTDYVFDGQATKPYGVDDARQPLGVYGRTKAQGEVAIEQAGCEHLIVRTSWLYASWGKNFVRTIAKLGREKAQLKVVDDQIGRPTSAVSLADATRRLLGRGARGVFHVTDGGQCSWYDFARQIVRVDGSACEVLPCTTAQFPRPAKRPAWSVLDLSATETLIGKLPEWQENLGRVMAKMEPYS